jgi:hypothetical protein
MPKERGYFIKVEPLNADEISRRKGVLQHTGASRALTCTDYVLHRRGEMCQ